MDTISSVPHLSELILITIVYLVTWSYCVFKKTGWLIDDAEGIAKFSDRWDKNKKEKIDYYEFGKDKKKYKNRDFNRHINFPGSVIRWIRLNLGGVYKEIGKDSKGHEVYGVVQDPRKHHTISLVIHYANSILCFYFLSAVFGSQVALYATLLFIVHPVSTQCVAWISGIGYLICLFGALATFCTVFYINNIFIYVPLVLLFSFLSAYGLFSGAFNWIILFALGFWPQALLSLGVFVVNLAIQGRTIITHRKNEFKKQNMGKSTFFHWKKPIVMLKTLWYYVRLVVFPKRLGLFHKWGYHYEEGLERWDWSATAGLLCLGVFGYCWFGTHYPLVFSALWFLTYLIVFSNFVTAMQFVVDRYCFIPSLGFCIAVAYFLQDYPLVFAFVLGLYMMRTLIHLPTYDNLIEFYKSNVHNFPTSEVALGNLGVTYMHHGKAGTAVDAWNEATKINKHYDVPLYNLYAMMKQAGQWDQAKAYLDACLKCKVVHFPELWTKEKKDLDLALELRKPLDIIKFNQEVISGR